MIKILVDPSTGLPLDDGSQGPMGVRAGLDALNSVGVNEQNASLLYDLSEHVPGMAVTGSWNMQRASNTIVRGGTARNAKRGRNWASGKGIGKGTSLGQYDGRGHGGFFRGGATQTFGPRHFRRMTRAANIDPHAYGKDSKIYSPFGIAAKAGNFGMRKIPKLAGVAEKMTGGVLGEGETWFSRGTMGRLSAHARIGAMDEKLFYKRQPRIMESIRDLNPGTKEIPWGKGFLHETHMARYGSSAFEMEKAMTQSQLINTMGGRVSQNIGGFIHGARLETQAAKSGSRAALNAGKQMLGGESAVKGFDTAVSALRAVSKPGAELGAKQMATKTLAKVAGSAAFAGASRAIPVAGQVLLIHDLALLAGTIVGRAGRTAIDATNSMLSPLNKPLMGAAYHDNSVAATSRQRGVMSIASSRLNMRSVLGSEAGMMAAHFG